MKIQGARIGALIGAGATLAVIAGGVGIAQLASADDRPAPVVESATPTLTPTPSPTPSATPSPTPEPTVEPAPAPDPIPEAVVAPEPAPVVEPAPAAVEEAPAVEQHSAEPAPAPAPANPVPDGPAQNVPGPGGGRDALGPMSGSSAP